MKTTKRLLSLVMIAVLLLCVFAGCSEKTPGTTTNAPDGTTAGSQGPNLENKHKLTILAFNNAGGDWDMNNYQETNVWPAFKAMLDKYGLELEFEFIEPDQYDTVLTTELAGPMKEQADLMWGKTDEVTTLLSADAGRLAALQDILVYSDGTAASFFEEHPEYLARSAYNGKNYWFGEYTMATMGGEYVGLGASSTTGPILRQDWLNKLGYTKDNLPDTVDEIEAFVLACQEQDANGNGVKDEYFNMMLHTVSAVNTGLNYFYGIPANEFSPNLQTHNVEVFWEQKNVKEYLKKLIDWIDKDIIAEDMVGDNNKFYTYNSANQAAALNTYFCDSWSFGNCPVPEGAEPLSIVGVMPDKTVHPDAHLGRDATPTMDTVKVMISADADLEAVAHLMDILYSEECSHLMTWGTEGESFAYDENGKEYYINGAENLANVATNPKATSMYNVFGRGALPSVFAYYPMEGDQACCYTDWQLETHDASLEWPAVYPNQVAPFYAVATPAEAEELASLMTDYQTLSDEIYVDILLGRIDIDTEWDSKVIKPLEEAGLLRIKEIRQAQLSRYFAFTE